MNSSQIAKIIKLNKEFYEQNASEFSSSRLYPWKGWFKLLPILNITDANNVSILDLGCGNGRFLDFLLKSTQMLHFTYLGIDSNKILLNFAKLKVKSLLAQLGLKSKVEFQYGDILDISKFPNKKFSLVVAFGVTHHIPGSNFRSNWFNAVSELVNKDGYLVFSFWYPDKAKLLNEKLEDFEDGDYLMSWDKNDTRRYIHIYSKLELDEFGKNLIDNGFELALNYKDDVKKDSFNQYFVYKKIR